MSLRLLWFSDLCLLCFLPAIEKPALPSTVGVLRLWYRRLYLLLLPAGTDPVRAWLQQRKSASKPIMMCRQKCVKDLLKGKNRLRFRYYFYYYLLLYIIIIISLLL